MEPAGGIGQRRAARVHDRARRFLLTQQDYYRPKNGAVSVAALHEEWGSSLRAPAGSAAVSLMEFALDRAFLYARGRLLTWSAEER